MAASIAKLAIVLTADDKTSAGFKSAANRVQGLAQQTSGVSSAMSAFAGIATKIVPLTLAYVAVRNLGKAAIQSAEESTRSAVEIIAAYEAMYKATTGREIDVGGPTSNDTIAGQYAKLKQELGESATGAHRLLVELLKIANVLQSDFNAETNWLFGSDGGAKQAQALKQMAADTKKMADEQKRMEEVATKANAAFEAMNQRLRSSAESITQSLRTPFEVAADAIAELKDLYERGMIEPETLTRGIERAKRDLMEVTKQAEKLQKITAAPGVAAAERNTMAGYSAVQSGKREMDAMIANQKIQAAEQKRTTDAVNKVNETLKNTKPAKSAQKVNI